MSGAADAKIHYSVLCDLFGDSEYELVLEFARDTTSLGYIHAGLRPVGGNKLPDKMHTWPVPVLLQVKSIPNDFKDMAKELGRTPAQLVGFIKGKAKDARFKL
jgi:hypothetical protein